MGIWHHIDVPITELCIDTTLRCGQSFRWKQSAPREYSCAIHGRLITLKQDATTLYYKATLPPALNNEVFARADDPMTPRTDSDQDEAELKKTRDFLIHYLNLEPDLGALYASWSAKDKNFAKKAPKFHGVRILKQDAWEALVGFICSSCNNIKRISQMMDKLCANYGPLIGYIDDVPYYDMPSAAALINPRVKDHLRELGFGYRAAYVYDTAQQVTREREGWLDSLRNPESPILGGVARPAGKMLPEGREGYREAHEQIIALRGVGAKVADCVCLFGLGWGEAVPVDTHVWQIAQRDYGFGKGKHKSLTTATYDAVANHFRKLWGKEAGWAHSVLFTADLRDFAEQLAAEVVKVEHVKQEIKVEYTPSKSLMHSSPLLSTPQTSIRGEIFSPASLQSPAVEIKYLSEEENIVPKQEIDVEIKQETRIITPVRPKKRKSDLVIKEETVLVKTEPASAPNKRRRSGRFRG